MNKRISIKDRLQIRNKNNLKKWYSICAKAYLFTGKTNLKKRFGRLQIRFGHGG